MLWIAVALAAAPIYAQATPRLGTINFPTSETGPAHERFIRGVLYLHSFEYEAAANEFREAQRLAPGFVMAYWGEAMTYNHPVWDQQDRDAAVAALGRLGATPSARQARTSDPRERAWLHAIEVLYGDGSKIRRDTLYADAMARLAASYPDDLEVQTFYALALMGMSQTTRVVPTYMRAGAIALRAMEKNPDHPGAAHYVIHAFDDPVHAPLGLPAARSYSEIAPGAAHAQHMTTHIFLALGMWDEVVSQNVIASGFDRARWLPGHYTSWLGYGLLQQGRVRESRVHLELVRKNLGTGRPGQRGSLMFMRAHHLINAETWSDTSLMFSVDPAGVPAHFVAIDAFAQAYRRLKLGETTGGLDSLLPKLDPMPVLKLEVEALLKFASRDTAGSLALLGKAAAIEDTMPMAFGPPDNVKPAHELLGELFFTIGRHRDARQAFERSLALAPGRVRSLIGLIRAARAEGNSFAADRAWSELFNHLEGGDWTIDNLR